MESVATVEEIRRFLTVPGSGSSSGYGDGSGSGSGSGYGDGYGDGSGYSSGDGDGDGDGSGFGSGSGYGYGDGSGSGYGYGYGDGYGDGDGDGYGSGDGDLKKFDGDDVYYIDGLPCLMLFIHRNIAIVAVIGNDFTLKSAYVAKVGRSFAHGETPREAVEAATQKDMEDRPLEERIDLFVETHPELDIPYGDLFAWHHTLTGSCEFGRREWCRAHGYQPDDSITVRTFIEQTRNDYGGDVIRQLAGRYGLTM